MKSSTSKNYPDEAPHHFRRVGETCVRNDIIKSLGWLDLIGLESRIEFKSESDWVGLVTAWLQSCGCGAVKLWLWLVELCQWL